MKKSIYFSFIVLLSILSCNINSRFTSPSDYIRYAGAVNGGGSGSSGGAGGKVIYYTLAINILGDGYVIVGSDRYISELKIAKNAKVRIEALADSGNKFQAWRGSISSEKQVEEIVMTGDMSIVCSFVLPTDKKILFVNIGRNGSVEIDGVLHKNDTGSLLTVKKEYENTPSVKLKAIPENDTFIFGGWSGSITPTTDLEITVPLESISTVLASFNPDEKVLVISLTPENYGYIEVSINGGRPVEYSDVMYIQKGSEVKIEAKLNDSRKFEFVKWNGSVISEDEIIDINSFDSDKSLIAEFKQVMKTLTIDIPSKEAIKTRGQAMSYRVNGLTYRGPTNFAIDTVLSVEAVEKYYPFTAWTSGVQDSDKNKKIISITLDTDKTVEASFETGVFDVYDNPELNGYNASAFDTWVIAVPDFGNEEIPSYKFYTAYTWGNPSLVDNNNGKITEYNYIGDKSKAAGFDINNMNYFMYKGENYYMNKYQGNNDPYNSGLHANRLKRFYFYRFTGKPLSGNLDNALCTVDTYTKLIYVYAVPTDFNSLFGQAVPTKWESIEVKDQYDYKFYEYDPIGYVDNNGNVTLFESFKEIQRKGSSHKAPLFGSMKPAAKEAKMKDYLPKAPSTTPAVAFDKTDKLNSLNTAGGNRSPYLE